MDCVVVSNLYLIMNFMNFVPSPIHICKGETYYLYIKIKMDPRLEKFIKKSNETHEFRYDYSKSTLKTTRDKVEIICRDHGSFFQRASAHTLGQGCPSCSNLSDRFENFIRKSKIIHKDKYDYSLVEYRGIYEPVIIICPKHGKFSQKPRLHISGYGCKRCGCEVKRDRKNFKKRKSLEQWIDKCNKVHGYTTILS